VSGRPGAPARSSGSAARAQVRGEPVARDPALSSGTTVLCMTVLEVADGRIVSQLAIQAWDE
jgi:hypothetical protein